MTRTLEHDVATYLWSEADRVVVYDTLADIEDDITFVPVARPSRHRNPAHVLMVAAALVVLVVGLVVARDTRPRSEPATRRTTRTPRVQLLTTTLHRRPGPHTPRTPARAQRTPPTPPPTTVPIARVPLPAGAVLQGIVPTCTTLDSIEYDCTIAAYPDVVTIDMTGYTNIIVDDTSHVSAAAEQSRPTR